MSLQVEVVVKLCVELCMGLLFLCRFYDWELVWQENGVAGLCCAGFTDEFRPLCLCWFLRV